LQEEAQRVSSFRASTVISALLSRRPAALLVVVLPIALGAPPGYSWSGPGHEVAGAIAERHLGPRARTRVRELLEQEPLATASTWADRMRSDPAHFWQEEAGPYHYVTVPKGLSYADVGAPTKGDALSALNMFARELRDPNTAPERQRLALRFSLHIVQDLHQPMHVGNGKDLGGNRTVVSVNGERSNLHRVWDSDILHSAGRNHRLWLDYFTDRGLSRAPLSADADPQLWIAESAALRDTLYPAPKVINPTYLEYHLPQAERRLALSGVRSAAWLNAVFGDDSEQPPALKTQAPSWWQRLFGN
jgi:hypothetical protein